MTLRGTRLPAAGWMTLWVTMHVHGYSCIHAYPNRHFPKTVRTPDTCRKSKSISDFWSGRGVTLRGTRPLAAGWMTLWVTLPRAQPDASPSVGICSGSSFWVSGHRRGYSVSRGVAVVTTCGGGCESSDCRGRSRLGGEQRCSRTMRSHGLDLLTQRWRGSETALRMACASAQLAVELRVNAPNEMVATPCPSKSRTGHDTPD